MWRRDLAWSEVTLLVTALITLVFDVDTTLRVPLIKKNVVFKHHFLKLDLPTKYQCMELCVAFALCRSIYYNGKGECGINSDSKDRQVRSGYAFDSPSRTDVPQALLFEGGGGLGKEERGDLGRRREGVWESGKEERGSGKEEDVCGGGERGSGRRGGSVEEERGVSGGGERGSVEEERGGLGRRGGLWRRREGVSGGRERGSGKEGRSVEEERGGLGRRGGSVEEERGGQWRRREGVWEGGGGLWRRREGVSGEERGVSGGGERGSVEEEKGGLMSRLTTMIN
ncbi:TATA-binding protein-associated factor 2N-like [Argopecten irradians]|uniref:TATA-binding protein-associated factor 2N-like n=1 Tax=Argopecten irradians TaxID=31199 RepID=UPI00371E428D